MSMGCACKFFGFSLSYTILNIPCMFCTYQLCFLIPTPFLLPFSSIKMWHKCFKDGQESPESDPYSGSPATSRTPENVDHIQAIVNQDQWLTVQELQADLGIPKTIVSKILTQEEVPFSSTPFQLITLHMISISMVLFCFFCSVYWGFLDSVVDSCEFVAILVFIVLIFIFFLISSFNISCNNGLVMMNSFKFTLSGKHFICPSIVNYSFAG